MRTITNKVMCNAHAVLFVIITLVALFQELVKP